MSLTNAAESDLLKLLFQNTAWANIGTVAGLQPSSSPGSYYVSLNTADVGQAGNQSTSEAAYVGYARVAVARSAAGWTISGSNPTSSANAAAVTFPASTSGPEVEAAFTVGVGASGATEALWHGTLTTTLTVNNGITPSFAAGQLVCTMQ